MSWYESMFHMKRTLDEAEIRWLQECGYSVNIKVNTIDINTLASHHRVFAGFDPAEITCNSLEQETVLRLKFGDDLIRKRVQKWSDSYVPKT